MERDSPVVVPLYQALYSQRAPDFVSENDEILKACEAVWNATEGLGMVVGLLVMAAAYFACVHLGSRAKPRILTCHVYEAAQRIFGIADFRFCAEADGIRQVLYGRSGAPKAPETPLPPRNLSLFPLGP